MHGRRAAGAPRSAAIDMSPASSADSAPATHLVLGPAKHDLHRPASDTRRHSRRSSLGELLKNVDDAGGESDDESSAIMAEGMTCQPDCQMVELGGSVPFHLQFKNLSYSVKYRSTWKLPAFSCSSGADHGDETGKYAKTKTILDDVSGEARDGEILAVLGQSGSGKSTLIDALADRIAKGSLKGTVTLNGETMDSGLLKAISAYVMQDDLLYPMLTVEETLMFSAEFRLPSTLSTAKKAARVQALIDQLGLRGAARTVIGDEGHRGVSGGERRRVSIGIDIIHDPIILFLDEPTSGLDSTSAFMVVQVLQRIARSGSIVVLTIHQPSYRIVGLLDQMIFLSRGQTVYAGAPSDLPVFFADFGNPIPDGENRTEFALDSIRELESSPDGTRAIVDFNRSWQSRSPKRHRPAPETRLTLNEAIGASICRGKIVTGGGGGGGLDTHRKVAKFANPWWAEAWVLSRRSMTNARRSPELFGVRLGAVLVTGFILATIFWHLDSSPRGVQERLGFFAYASATIFFTCAESLPVFIMERFIFMRETAYNAYRRSSYVLSNAVVSFPSLVALSLAFSSVTFWSVGLAGGFPGFAYFFAVILASFWAGASFITFLSGVVSNHMMGYTVVIASLANFLLLSGFFITRDRIPAYWKWLHYLSLVKYPYEGVMQNEMDDPSKCFVRGEQIFDNTPLGALPAASKAGVLSALSRALGVSITERSCVTTGVDILRQAAVTDLTMWGCVWVLLAWGFFFRIVFYFSLLLGSKNKRR